MMDTAPAMTADQGYEECKNHAAEGAQVNMLGNEERYMVKTINGIID